MHPSGEVYAGWGPRVAADILDNVVVLAANFVLYAIGVGSSGRALATIVVAVAYNGLLDGGPTGQTFGKKLLKIRVIDDDGAGTIGPGRGAVRAVVPIALGLVGFSPALALVAVVLGLLNGLWPLWDRRKQTWHDKAVRSVVVVA